MAIWDFLFGKGERQGKRSLQTQEQQMGLQNYFNNPINQNPLYQSGGNYLQQLLSNEPGAFEAFEAPYMKNFQQNIAPQIAERFGGYGTGAGGLNSSGFQNSIAQAGYNLQAQLASLRGGLQQNAVNQGLQYAQQPYSNLLGGLGVQAFQPYHTQRQSGFYENMLQALAGSAGGALRGGF